MVIANTKLNIDLPQYPDRFWGPSAPYSVGTGSIFDADKATGA